MVCSILLVKRRSVMLATSEMVQLLSVSSSGQSLFLTVGRLPALPGKQLTELVPRAKHSIVAPRSDIAQKWSSHIELGSENIFKYSPRYVAYSLCPFTIL